MLDCTVVVRLILLHPPLAAEHLRLFAGPARNQSNAVLLHGQASAASAA
jgi:hypothetical protein